MTKKKTAKVIKKTMRIVFGIVAAVLLIIAAVCIGYGISWIANGTNTTAGVIVILIIGILALVVVVKIVQKIRDSIAYERDKSRSGGSSSRTPREPLANRSLGSEGELKRAVLSALPSSGASLGSWGHGSACLRSIGVDIWVSPRRISINATIEYKVEYVDYYDKSAIQSAAQDHLNSEASDFTDRVKDAVEDYIYKYSGFDGNWSISANNITAKFTS